MTIISRTAVVAVAPNCLLLRIRWTNSETGPTTQSGVDEEGQKGGARNKKLLKLREGEEDGE